MVVRLKQAGKRYAVNAFSLIEALVAIVIFGLVMMGIINGYIQANRMAEWSSQSLAATSYAMQGIEQMRSVQWDAEEDTVNGTGTTDPLLQYMKIQSDGTWAYWTNQVDTLDIPTTGSPIFVTNYLYVTPISTNPPLRRIVSQVVWTFNLTGQLYTNTIVSLRAPDQLQ
jgi:type II secretory pathway pseudopilin PulG